MSPMIGSRRDCARRDAGPSDLIHSTPRARPLASGPPNNMRWHTPAVCFDDQLQSLTISQLVRHYISYCIVGTLYASE